MAPVLIFAVTASNALIVGALVGTRWEPPQRLLAAVLAFAGGSLTAALAFEAGFLVSFMLGSAQPGLAAIDVYVALALSLSAR